MNKGKRFERNIIDSCKEQNIFIWKIPDTYIPAKNINSNAYIPEMPCDFVIAYQKTGFVEAKETDKAYITFARDKDSTGQLKGHQGTSLLKFNQSKEVCCGLFLNIQDQAYYWPIEGFKEFYLMSQKKSFNRNDILLYRGVEIPQQKKKTNYVYDIANILIP